MLKTAFFALTPLLLLLFPAALMAIAPPAVVCEANLEARLIVVGRVTGLQAGARPPHFLLRPIHVVKGLGQANLSDTLKVLTGAGDPGQCELTAVQQGVLPVRVNAGALVVVYVDPVEAPAGFFKPKLQGLSVVTIE